MGRIDGRYELGALLGAGGMADVWRARDVVLDRDVAVKVFRPGGDEARARAEVRVHAGLSHPGLVSAYDAGSDERGRPYLVLQLVEGPTLAELVRRGPLPEEHVRQIGSQVAEALAHVHSRGVVHRDVKPANLLLDAAGLPHLADFGIAQESGAEGLTATGFTLGTVPYLSPEQVRGQAATTASDVYALGLVLLEALTGRREYPGLSAEGALARLTRDPVVDPALPAPWPDLLPAMTAAEPERRPGAAEVAAVLRGEATAPTTVALAVPAQRRGARTAAVAVAGLAVVCAAVAVPQLQREGRAPERQAVTPTAQPAVQPVAKVVVPAPPALPTAQARPAAAVTRTTAPAVTRAPTAAPPPVKGEKPRERGKRGKGRGR